ncbi:MAG TPA: HXXEE domain-containing protein, partial [Parvularculaceae bacterium]|nr:HXXEE domain-containing protein [Parvularculaceae bacterium]
MKTDKGAPAPYGAARWLVIPVIAAHNFEEWLTFPSFHNEAAAKHLGLPFQAPSWLAMQIGFVLVTLAPACIVVWASLGRQRWWKDIAVCWVGGIFFANIFLPHIPAAIIVGGYSPGVLTAVLVNLPFFPFLFWRAVRDGYLTARQVLFAVLIGAASLPVSIVGVLAL